MKKFKIIRFILFFAFLVPLFLPFAHAQFLSVVESKFTPNNNKSPCGSSCSAARPAQQPNQNTPVNSQAHASGGVRVVITQQSVSKANYGDSDPAYQKVPMPQMSNNLPQEIKQAKSSPQGRVEIKLIDFVPGNQVDQKGQQAKNVDGGPVFYKEAQYDKTNNVTKLFAEYKSMPDDVDSWAKENLRGYSPDSYDGAKGGPGFSLDTKITGLDPLTGLSPELAAGVKSLKPDTQLWGIVIKNEQGEPLAALTWFSDQNQYKVARYIDEKGVFRSENTTLERLLTDLNVNAGDKLTALVKAGKLESDGVTMPKTYILGQVEFPMKDFDRLTTLGGPFGIHNMEALVRGPTARMSSLFDGDPFAQGVDRLNQLMSRPQTMPIQITLVEEGSDNVLARFNRNLNGSYELRPEIGAFVRLEDLPQEFIPVVTFGTVEAPLSGHSATVLKPMSDPEYPGQNRTERLGVVKLETFAKFMEDKIKKQQ